MGYLSELDSLSPFSAADAVNAPSSAWQKRLSVRRRHLGGMDAAGRPDRLQSAPCAGGIPAGCDAPADARCEDAGERPRAVFRRHGALDNTAPGAEARRESHRRPGRALRVILRPVRRAPRVSRRVYAHLARAGRCLRWTTSFPLRFSISRCPSALPSPARLSRCTARPWGSGGRRRARPASHRSCTSAGT